MTYDTKHKCLNKEKELYGRLNCGPIFGGGFDLCIYNKLSINNISASRLGDTYELPGSILFKSDVA